jgi:hypothetical protein
MNAQCTYETYERRCPLSGHRSDVVCSCKGKDACRHFFCACHYARTKESFKSADEEYRWFLDWCRSGRWAICLENPALLWRILCGVASLNDAPYGSFHDPQSEPWLPVITGHMSKDEYSKAWPKDIKHTRVEIMPSAGEIIAMQLPAETAKEAS